MGPVDHHNWHQLRWWRWPLFNCAVWHFTVDPYFTPESDTVSQEPLPDESGQEWGSKMMEEETGHPAVMLLSLSGLRLAVVVTHIE